MLSKTQTSQHGNSRHTLNWGYNPYGQLDSLNYPSGLTLRYSHDAQGRIDGITANPLCQNSCRHTGHSNCRRTCVLRKIWPGEGVLCFCFFSGREGRSGSSLRACEFLSFFGKNCLE
ncbi:MAG: RHS repeat protein [Methylococcales bacterium]|nr:RHS repeat protein [Methylococcales bacterium]